MLASKLFRAASTTLRNGQHTPLMMIPIRSFSLFKKTDLVDVILNDHREAEECYHNYKSAKTAEERDKWFNQFVWENCRHAVSEEIVVFPMMRALGPKGEDFVEESLVGHRRIKVMLEDLGQEKDDTKFEIKLDATFKELLDHHNQEEKEDLPYIKDNISLEDRQKAATRFTLGKTFAPSRPHSGVPDKSAAIEMALGLLITPVDKLRDAFTSFPDKEK